jgi:hypothetical protein
MGHGDDPVGTDPVASGRGGPRPAGSAGDGVRPGARLPLATGCVDVFASGVGGRAGRRGRIPAIPRDGSGRDRGG